jgi:hypothetical protein
VRCGTDRPHASESSGCSLDMASVFRLGRSTRFAIDLSNCGRSYNCPTALRRNVVVQSGRVMKPQSAAELPQTLRWQPATSTPEGLLHVSQRDHHRHRLDWSFGEAVMKIKSFCLLRNGMDEHGADACNFSGREVRSRASHKSAAPSPLP